MVVDDQRSKILIVDDTTENLNVLQGLLEDSYKIFAVPSGRIALKIAEQQQPDLILLDIMMPDMDGYEVCKHLKSSDKTCEIPVIFITAKSETIDEIKAFEVGGIDYITKPITPQIVLKRVEAHLALKREKELLKENLRLREDVERIMCHDLKQPLTPIISYPSIFETENLTNSQIEYLDIIRKSGYRLLSMINLSLDLYKMEKGTYNYIAETMDIIPIIEEIVKDNRTLIKVMDSSVDLLFQGEKLTNDHNFMIDGDRLLIYSLLGNLIKNSAEATPRGERITINLEQNGEQVINIHNKGAVPIEIRDHFFDKYTTSGKVEGTGLGTYSAKLITETMKGKISMKSSEREGTTIRIELPWNN